MRAIAPGEAWRTLGDREPQPVYLSLLRAMPLYHWAMRYALSRQSRPGVPGDDAGSGDEVLAALAQAAVAQARNGSLGLRRG